MKVLSRIILLSSAGIAAATLAWAQVSPEEALAIHQAREEHMKAYAAQMGILGGMAQGNTAYDAAAAQAAADTLVTLSQVDQSTWWPPESAAGLVEGSRASPAIWENMEDVMAKGAAFGAAALAMQAAAGTDLAALQAAMGPLGGSCGACHEAYRTPE